MVGYLGVCLGERGRWDTHTDADVWGFWQTPKGAHCLGIGAPRALPEELDT